MNWRDLSMNMRLVALVIGLAAIALLYVLSTRIIFGRAVVTVAQPNAYVADQLGSLHDSPARFRVKPGRYQFVAGASGYLDQAVPVTVWPFLTHRRNITLQPDYSFENDHFRIVYQYDRESYLIVPKIDLTNQQSPEVQMAQQWATYEKYAKEALGYFKSKKVDTQSLPIEWWGKEWWPRGRQIAL